MATSDETLLAAPVRVKRNMPKLSLRDIDKDTLRNRTKSLMWETEFDPFQVFQVEHDPCLDLEIVVHKGEDITKGNTFKDWIDTPDPYVILKVPSSSNSSKRTSGIDNSIHPIWEETFHFYLDPTKVFTLEVTLMDANYTNDEELGKSCLQLSSLTQDAPVDYVFMFPGGSKVHATLTLTKNKKPDLRFSLALCEEEKVFLRLRRQKILGNLNKLLGEDGPADTSEVPIFGILGSGGGFRAMTCLSGAVKALYDSGVLQCATYIAGLSGSSWYISTLYGHDKFPDVNHDVIYNSLKESVTNNWMWNLSKTSKYLMDMSKKYSKGQPISFTDFFGHLLGDVLLKGAKHKKLTDQQLILRDGTVPFPLYTCLHAKSDVSCRKFSEWVEFSPYEIGIAKYGTFMKTEHFGCKFIVGKLIKQFPELPLHFLQGVWGSAFTILIKRLLNNDRRDNVQIMREEAEAEAQLISNNNDSDSEDDEEVIGQDDSSGDEHSQFQDSLSESFEEQLRKNSLSKKINQVPNTNTNTNNGLDQNKNANYTTHNKTESTKTNNINGNAYNNSDYSNNNNNNIQSKQPKDNIKPDNPSNFQLLKKKSQETVFNFKRKISNEIHRKTSTVSDPGISTEDKVSKQPLARKHAVDKKSTASAPEAANGEKIWTNRRRTFRQKREDRKKSFFDNIKEQMMKESVIFNTRSGRAGEILNPFRGLCLKETFPLSPFHGTDELDSSEPEGDFHPACRNEPLDNKAKKLFIVDSGLAFNSPFPLLLRPQRAVDMYLSFDFSQRVHDNETNKKELFRELLLAEKWACQNKVTFPPIEEQIHQYTKEKDVKEVYVFKDPDDPLCPVILHFPLVNNNFKLYSKPGVKREKEEMDFADFEIFNNPSRPYDSTNFMYTELQFDRLVNLMEFNTLHSLETIKNELKEIIKIKKQSKNNVSNKQNIYNVFQKVKGMSSFKKGGLRLTIHEEREKELELYSKKVPDSARLFSSSSESYASATGDLPDGFKFS